jgi:hypothetical protein
MRPLPRFPASIEPGWKNAAIYHDLGAIRRFFTAFAGARAAIGRQGAYTLSIT